jgi:hypothetical protein
VGWLTGLRAELLIPFVLVACGSAASDSGGQSIAGSGGLGGNATSSTSGGNGGAGGSAVSASGGDALGGSSGGSAAGAVSGASSAAGASGASGSSGAPLGSITIYSMVFNGVLGPVLNVTFPATTSGGTTASTCTSTSYGSCSVTDCMASTSTSTPAPTMRLSAGTINVDSDAANVHLSATPDANGNYTQADDPSNVQFRGSEAFTVTGSGAAIPAFTSSATYPLLLIMTGPPPPAGVSEDEVFVNVPRTAPATLTWQRGASGVDFVVQTNGSVPNGGHYTSLYCQVDSQPGTMTIAAEALSAFPSGTQLQLFTAGLSTVQAGSQGINIWAVGNAITADKMGFVSLMLE